MALYMGLDVGGTTVKGIITDENGKIICENSVPTLLGNELADCIITLADTLVQTSGSVYSSLVGVGVCCPGIIDGATGTVVFAGNLKVKNYPLKKILEDKLGVTVKIANDANAAALGEAKFGAGKGYKDSVLITLGTGVGGGIILDGKIFEGNLGAGAEVGHMVIEHGGHKCTCGRRGCFEVYCSARALTAKTKWAMEEDTSSEMWKGYNYDTADGRTAFEYMDSDRSAKQVVDWYLKYLACGVANLANIFRPQIIMIGGGVAAQGSRLTAPLQKLLDKELFGGTGYAPVPVACATLGNRAGAYGAAALLM
ncbi:MAG: ROK family protein [Clostridia bacterium]|nr:ROK family protein [Clostridia bacterium]